MRSGRCGSSTGNGRGPWLGGIALFNIEQSVFLGVRLPVGGKVHPILGEPIPASSRLWVESFCSANIGETESCVQPPVGQTPTLLQIATRLTWRPAAWGQTKFEFHFATQAHWRPAACGSNTLRLFNIEQPFPASSRLGSNTGFSAGWLESERASWLMARPNTAGAVIRWGQNHCGAVASGWRQPRLSLGSLENAAQGAGQFRGN